MIATVTIVAALTLKPILIAIPETAAEGEAIYGSVLSLKNGIYVRAPVRNLQLGGTQIEVDDHGGFHWTPPASNSNGKLEAIVNATQLSINLRILSPNADRPTLLQTTQQISPGELIRVDGLGLQGATSAHLISASGSRFEMPSVFRSSYQAGWICPLNVGPGSHHLEVQFLDGSKLTAQGAINVTRLTLKGDAEIPRGKKTEVSIEANANVSATVFAETQNILLAPTLLKLAAGKSQRISVDAKAVGKYSISANSVCVANQYFERCAVVAMANPNFASGKCTMLLHVLDELQFPIEMGTLYGFVRVNNETRFVRLELKTFGRAELALLDVESGAQVAFVPFAIQTPLGRYLVRAAKSLSGSG